MVNRVLWRDHSRIGRGVRQEKEVAALVGLSPRDMIPGSEQKGWGQDSEGGLGGSPRGPAWKDVQRPDWWPWLAASP